MHFTDVAPEGRKVTESRVAGALIPLFSIRSRHGFGVGEFPDLVRMGPVLRDAGFRLWMTLPLLEPSPGQESPYAPISFFALDPLYVALDDVPEIARLGGTDALMNDDDRRELAHARASSAVDHGRVRPLKERLLRRAYESFVATNVDTRRTAFDAFRHESRAWLADYALFRTLKERYPSSWRAWPAPLRAADPATLEAARIEHADEIEFRAYVQWVAFEQLRSARVALAALGIALGGDEPFLAAEDSADVFAHQDHYRFDATVGAPPDAFSATGQDWGLPPYRWDRIRDDGYRLFLERGEHAAKLFDVVRIDHVVGLYRTYHRPLDKSANYFVPTDEPSQLRQGEAVLEAFRSHGAALIAEDLGVIPDFVRASLERLRIPGYRVLRWEERNGRIRPPEEWPALSVATNGTHDTETTAAWWESLDARSRRLVDALPGFDANLSAYYTAHVHDKLLYSLYHAPSDLAIFPIQDLFGLRGRINVPNTVGPHNWAWRMPWSIENLASEPHVAGQLARLRQLSESSGRFA